MTLTPLPAPLEASLVSILPELTAIRQDLHRNPEIGFQEHRTAAIVAAKLRQLGLEVTEGIGGTGVVGTLRAGTGNRAIGLRADMDALAMTEKSGVPHASEIGGMMHGCGHDGHTTMLLGAAEVLAKNPDFSGTVHFIFQPAEEGLGGAQAMIREGLFEKFPCDAVFGLHNKPNLPEGQLNVVAGPMMAAADLFTVVFGGSGGHGGSGAHLSIDPTLAASQFILSLQTIVGRNISPFDQGVVSVGYVGGGNINAPNVIPSDVTVRGTTRCFSATTRDLIERRLGELAAAAAQAYGTTLEVKYERKFPALINAADSVTKISQALRDTLGAEAVNEHTTPSTGAEDFAYMLEQSTGCFMYLGSGEGPALHSDRYDFNDNLIANGIRYWAIVTRAELPA